MGSTKMTFSEKLVCLQTIKYASPLLKCHEQLVMSQSTSPLSFSTYQTPISPYLQLGCTYLCTCIIEKAFWSLALLSVPC